VRVRLRPPLTAEEAAGFYATPHDHTQYPSHTIRVEHTIALARDLSRITRIPAHVVADLSCGNAAIPRALAEDPVLGDLAPGYPLTGPLEHTIPLVDYADLWVLSETAEHLENPDMVVSRIREKASLLVLSTPLGEFTSDNEQHLWGWDQQGVRDMLEAAEWQPKVWSTVTMPDAAFQIWGCR
jgi:hypothetical protein